MIQSRLTPASYNHRVMEWANAESSWDTMPRRTSEEVAARYVSDNELTAMLLLRDALDSALVKHPRIAEWAENLVQDTTYTEYAPEVDYNPEDWENPHRAKRLDDLIIELGEALVVHRLYGEEGHADGLPLSPGEYPPLSKAIARYTKGLGNFYASELQRIRELGE